MPEAERLLRSALHDKHVAMEAKMSDEAGWSMPLSYGGAMAEADETRSRAGVFDVSHFGRIRIRGDGALDLLERVCTADVAHQEDDTSIETLLCNDRGGIIDCCRLIRLASFWVLVTSPICRQKVLDHLAPLAERLGAKVDDQTTKTTMLMVAGPAAGEILSRVLPFSIADLATGDVKLGSLMIARYIAERIGFGGLWAARVSIPNMVAQQAWRFITEKAGDNKIAPAGLAALDVLRIEGGQCRYGHEINETIDPIAAGLERAVDFGREFIGSEALVEIRRKGASRALAGLVLGGAKDAKGSIPRQGAVVAAADGGELGVVTSGTFSAALGKPIALALVARGVAEAGDELLVETSAGKLPAKLVELPLVSGNESSQ